MIAIPAIDLMEGQCVRLSQGDYDRQTVYDTDPVRVAARFANAGCSWLHLVDLEGARAREIRHAEVLRKIVAETGMRVEYGGGITDRAAAEAVLEAGAERIIVGSLAVRQPEVVTDWIRDFGAERIVLGADLKEGCITISGWEETADQDWREFLVWYTEAGIRYVLCTEVSRDGMLQGPATDLYLDIRTAYPDIQLLASGGVRNREDLTELASVGCHGAIVGKALYEGHIELDELKPFGC